MEAGGVVHADGGAEGGEEVGDADGIGDDLFRDVIGLAPRAAMAQAASGEHAAEGAALMTATTAAVELGRTTELGGDDDERLVEQTPGFKIGDECGDGAVEFLDQLVLFQDALIVRVPAGAVEEVQVVRDFDEAHALLDQSAAEQTTLPELAAVALAQCTGFFVELEDAIERRAAELQALLDS